MTSTANSQQTAQATANAETPEATQTADTGARKRRVAPTKAKSRKKASPAKKGAKAAKRAKTQDPAAKGARQGSKTEKVLNLLKRSGGASLKDIMKATDWQAHSVRGFLSATIGKKMGLKLESTKREDGERAYSVAK